MTRHPDLPTDAEIAVINAAFHAGHLNQTGFCNDLGQPAPWPDDLDDWRPSTDNPTHYDI